jgi:hypothetical protein
VEVPLSWERLLWSHHTWWRSRPRYVLTDLRVVSIDVRGTAELAIEDIDDVQILRTTADRVMGRSTIVVRPRRRHIEPMTLRHVRRGAQLAALLELLADDPSAATDAIAVESMLAWTPPATAMPLSRLAAGLATAGLAFSAVVIGLHGESSAVVYPEHDAIRPGGEKRDREAIVDFMETEVLPWAQVTLGPLKGGADRVGCETCHGVDPDSRNWTMPSVAALPEPQVQQYGSEHVDTTVGTSNPRLKSIPPTTCSMPHCFTIVHSDEGFGGSTSAISII